MSFLIYVLSCLVVQIHSSKMFKINSTLFWNLIQGFPYKYCEHIEWQVDLQFTSSSASVCPIRVWGGRTVRTELVRGSDRSYQNLSTPSWGDNSGFLPFTVQTLCPPPSMIRITSPNSSFVDFIPILLPAWQTGRCFLKAIVSLIEHFIYIVIRVEIATIF